MLTAIVLSGLAEPANGQEPQTRTIEIDQRTRVYDLYQPRSGESVPLLVVLHGGFQTKEGIARVTRFHEVALERGFAVAYPQGLRRSWDAGMCCGGGHVARDDVAFIAALIDDASEIARIDRARVYAAGISNGGMMSFALACRAAPTFAAIGVVAGTMQTAECDPDRPVPLMMFHGTDDPLVPYEGGVAERSFARSRRGQSDPSVSDVVAFWRGRNGCDDDASTFEEDDIVRETYCAGSDREVVLYTIDGGQHGWPGTATRRAPRFLRTTDTIDASELLIDFFSHHSR